MMKRILVILLMLFAASVLLSAAASSRESIFAGIIGQGGAAISTPGIDAKKVDDRMADALSRLDSWKKLWEREKVESAVGSTDQAELSSRANSTSTNSTSINSTPDNNSIIGPSGNSSTLDSLVDQDADAGRIDANVGSSSEGRFKGFYGMTSSRHEIGKSGIDSRMFLSGNFEMEKMVKFQDRGID